MIQPDSKQSLSKTFSDLDADSSALGSALRARLSGTRAPVVLLSPNNYDFVVGLTAIWKAGCPAVPLCNNHPSSEWEYYIEDSGAPLYLVHPSFASSMAEIASKKGGSMLLTSDSVSAAPSTREPEVWSKDNALFVYTSGTTGRPKGVVTTHSNVEASVSAMVEAWEWSPTDHILHVLPLHHVHGLVNALITPLAVGATVEMLPKFDAKQVWARFVESHHLRSTGVPFHSSRNTSSHDGMAPSNASHSSPNSQNSQNAVTVFMAVPPIYVALIKEYDSMDTEHQSLCSSAVKSLRLMVSGSAALPEPILHRWEAISGHRLLERYGMTEIGMALTNPYRDGLRRPGWVGTPFPGVTARIQPDEESRDYDGSLTGELHIKGPQVFKEYWRREKATTETFTSDGWFKTGDSAEFDSSTGYYRIMGRRSVDILKTGAYKVSALDIEAELLSHPDIHEVAVVGIEDLEWGQIVGAIVALRSTADPTTFGLKTLQDWARSRIASYKLPRRLLIVPQIPRNAMGKVNKKELVKLFGTSN